MFRNAKFTDGLAQSRLRFVGDLEGLFGMTGPLEETLEKLEEVCMCAYVIWNCCTYVDPQGRKKQTCGVCVLVCICLRVCMHIPL